MAVPTTSLVLDLRAGVGLTLSGSEITAWADQSGAGNHCTGQTANTSKPISAVDAAGQPVVRFQWGHAAVHPQGYFTIPTSLSGIATRAVTVVAVCTNNIGTDNQSLVNFTGFASGYASFQKGAELTPFLQIASRGSLVRPPMNKSVYVWSGRAADSVVQWNNTRATVASVGSATGLAGGEIGRYGASAYSGDLYRLLIYNAALTNAQIDAIVAAVIEEHNVKTSYDKLLVFEGDSLTAGVNSSDLKNYPNQIVTPNFDWLSFNLGRGSALIGAGTGISGEAATQIDPLFTEFPYSRRVLVNFAGTNDIGSGQTGAQTFTRLTDFFAARKAVGWETWQVTIPARTGFSTPVGDYNALIRAGHASIDKIVDVGLGSTTETRLSNAANTTYFYTDALHLVNAGYAVVANGVGAELNPVTATPPIITSASTKTGQVGVPLSYTITATGTAPITYGVSGTLPAGLTFDGTATISGTPTTAGVRVATITATNSAGEDSDTLTFTIAAAPPTGDEEIIPGEVVRNAADTILLVGEDRVLLLPLIPGEEVYNAAGALLLVGEVKGSPPPEEN